MDDQTPFADAEFAENSEQRCACALLLDTSGSMQGAAIDQLNEGLATFRRELSGDSLAAKRVENTYTPFDPIGTAPIPNTPQPQGRQTYYNGIFIGAEKFWVGDAVRFRNGAYATDMFLLREIIELPLSFSANSRAPGDPVSLATARHRLA